jgi:hypothetical protein
MAPSSIFLGETEIENRYFRYFQEIAADDLDIAWEWHLWNRLMPQNSHQEPFIRHSCIALGALLKAHEAACSAGTHPYAPVVPGMAKLHRDFAVAKYDVALNMMRRALSAKTTPRQALLGCIFIVCFELLLGNRHFATRHAQAGATVLYQWRAQNQQQPQRLLSPAPSAIEDEIVAAFYHLDIQVMTVSDTRPVELHEELKKGHCTAISSLPAFFVDLHEARILLDIVVSRSCHFLATSWSPCEALALAKDFDLQPPCDVNVVTGMNIYSTSFKVTEDIQRQQLVFAAEIASWEHAFAPLLENSRVSMQSGASREMIAYNVAARLKIQCIATSILIAGVVITNQMEYDNFNSQFQELVDLASEVVRLSGKSTTERARQSGFWLDCGISPHLFVVVTRCRDPGIRRRAIKLLEDWQIEGNWDAKMIAQIGYFMLEVEEEGMIEIEEGGEKKRIIPESARAVFSRVSDDSQNQRALLQCVLRKGGENCGLAWREKYVEW